MRGRRTWLLILLCAGLLLTIIASGGSGQAQLRPAEPAPSAAGQTSAEADDQAGRFSVTTTAIGGDRAIVIVDARTQRLLVYSMDTSSRPPLLKLMAVRNISHDVKLEHWNNAHPYPDEIRRNLAEGSPER